MSGKIRKLLGPVRKRLTERIGEVQDAMIVDDASKLKSLRSKIVSNLKYHAELTDQLGDVVDEDDVKQQENDTLLEKCVTLNIDAKESISLLDIRIDEVDCMKPEIKEEIRLNSLKIQEEIENLKLERSIKTKTLEKLNTNDNVKTVSVKLPKLMLPVFGGDVTEWPTFWDNYRSTIHENRALTNVDKFKYLLSCLVDEAKDTLRGFKITDSQYEAAVKLLRERYDDQEFIVHTNYEKLTSLPTAKNNTKELRSTLNLIETILRCLESLGENIGTRHLTSLILAKFPSEFRLKLEELKQNDWNIITLRAAINKLIVAREKADVQSELPEESEFYDYTVEGLFSKETKEVRVKCVFCGMSHYPDECQKFKTVEQRKGQIKGRCFVCFSQNHFVSQCKSGKVCFYCKKRNNHHSSLCNRKFSQKIITDDYIGGEVNQQECGLINVEEGVIMKTASVTLMNPSNRVLIQGNALLDTGAKHSYITTDAATRLGLKHGPASLVKLNTFGNENSSTMYVHRTSLQLRLADGSYSSLNIRTCKNITGVVKKNKIDVKKYDAIWKDLKMADELPTKERMVTIDLLIGNDYYDEIIGDEKMELDKGFYMVNSSLGWIFSGRVPNPVKEEGMQLLMLMEEESIDVSHSFWTLEGIGISSSEVVNSEDSDAIDSAHRSIKLENGRYQVGWPWNLSKYELPSNYGLCVARLKSQLNKLDKDSKLVYNDIIMKQVNDGIIEYADFSEEYKEQDNVVTHYLPHHIVDNGKKLRVVYEGNAKTNISKKSLNDCLSRGPNLVEDLAGVFLRFRMNPIAFVADIERAYVQLALNPVDRDVTRFLWVKNVHEAVTDQNIIEFRFCRVIWGIISSSFLLAFAITYHLQKENNEICKDILKNIYVDNLASGTSCVNDAELYYRKTKATFLSMSMNMCKWNTNSKSLYDSINVNDRCSDEKVKVLGMIWNTKSDSLNLMKIDLNVRQLTKRNILKVIGSFYDPLGMFAPLMLLPKLFIQNLWRLKFGWDDLLSEDLQTKWKKISHNLEGLHDISISRCIDNLHCQDKCKRLVVFVDASKDAYATSIYLKVGNGNLSNVDLVFSKNRLVPMNVKLSIPRLELMGVVIGCRAAKYLYEQLGLTSKDVILFTDSKCAIEWIRTNKKLSRFVNSRVAEIHDYSIKITYVKSEDNPADIATRGSTVNEIKCNKLWWNGPDWLKLSEEDWPQYLYDIEDETRLSITKEEMGNKVLYETGLVAEESKDESNMLLGINIMRFATYVKLLRVTAWCLRFIANSKSQIPVKGVLTPQELKFANNLWIKFVQRFNFLKTIDALIDDKPDQLVSKLGLYLDVDGIIRCGGRFRMVHDNPVLLPKKGYFTRLVILKYHRQLLHAGVKHTLAAVRDQYWILQGRSAVQSCIRQCLICIHWEGGPFKTPPFAPFPKSLLQIDDKPFQYVGLDYLGPLLVNNEQRLIKNWICLFTCLKIRAVHLELVETLSAKSFLLCMRRFIARRGTPAMIISDNGSQIKLGSNVIQNIWSKSQDNDDVQSFVADKGISWKFVTEHAPWQGGFYERLVRTVKSALKKSLGKSKIGTEQMTTLITEIESVVNSRPLLYSNDDINSIESLTPAHFISLNYKIGTPEVLEEFRPRETSATSLLETWRKGQVLLNRFWQSWSSEYFQELRERNKLKMKQVKGEIERYPKPEEVVLVREPNISRGNWKMAKVIKVICSEIDKVPRAVKLLLSSRRVIKRPLKDVYPLEVN